MYPHDPSYQPPPRERRDNGALWLAIGVGALAGAAGVAFYQQQTRNQVRTARPTARRAGPRARAGSGGYAVTGRTVTIKKPRARALRLLARLLEPAALHGERARTCGSEGDLTRWTIRGPMGRDVDVETRIVEDREGELIAWRSTEALRGSTPRAR